MCIALKFIDVIQYIPHGQREKKIAANFYAMIERPASPIYIDSFNIDTVYVFFFSLEKIEEKKIKSALACATCQLWLNDVCVTAAEKPT